MLASWVAGYGRADFYQWAIVVKSEGASVGSISAVHLDDRVESCEIGYCIGKKWSHRGIMTEDLGAVMDYLLGESG